MPSRNIVALLIIISAIITAPICSYSQVSEDRPVKYIRGRVCGINYTSSRVTIQWLYTTDKLSQQNVTFFVPSNTLVLTEKDRIFDAPKRAGIIDLVIGDHVIIKYYTDKKNGYFEAINIRILEHDIPMVP